MKTTVSKWGKALGIRIPRHIADNANIEAGQELDVTLSRGVIRVERPRFTLEELVAQITPENTHEEIDWGEPRGSEVW